MGDPAVQGAEYPHWEHLGFSVLQHVARAKIRTANSSANWATAAIEQKIFTFF